jgi:dienelactone hydrolase
MSLPFTVRADETSQFEKIDPSYYETDVNSLINVASAADIAAKRQALIGYIWGGKGFPAQKLPAEVKQDIKDERYAGLFNANLKQIDRLTVNMDYGLESVIYHFIPKAPINKLIIYHQGHRGDFIQGIDTIRAFIERGCAVMAVSMPLLGMNNQPVVNLERFGKFHVTKHTHLRLLENPINYFVEPIAVAVNYAEKFEYDRISMIGISGGGWTTTIYAAIDTRIKRSYPVAGSLPIYLRSDSQRDWGDFEQTLPDLYNIANYLELYMMGSYGAGRRQVQILNKYDSCCFAGIKYRTYERVVKDTVARLGKGNFGVFLDDAHKEHKISDEALRAVFAHEGL